MKLIAITSENADAREVDYVKAIIDHGFYCVHVRKPAFTTAEMRSYLDAIPCSYLSRITLGSHSHLAAEYAVGGIHYKSCEPVGTNATALSKSKSCHSIDEVKQCASMVDYAFLSPIFDSISKAGYNSHFEEQALRKYADQGLLDNVVALGGIDGENVVKVRDLGFAGAAFLGYLMHCSDINELTQRLKIISDNIKE